MRTSYNAETKAKIVLEVLSGENTINEIASSHNIHPNLLIRWKTQAISNLPQVFDNESIKTKQKAKEIEKEKDELYKQIGKLTSQIEWLKKNLASNTCRAERRAMIELPAEGVPVSVQADLLGFNRTSLYYKPKAPGEKDLAIKEAIDRIYTEHPEFGYRRITVWLKKHENLNVNHKAIQRHMQEMGIQAVFPRRNTSKPNPANKVYPYLLKGLEIDKLDYVWSIDITYIPLRRSWLYLTAILDWYLRYVVAWMIDDTLEIDFVLETCRNALKTSAPRIMNSDQGSHFTSPKYTELFLKVSAAISMDHRGRAYDNIFIERLWRSVKYENVYPHGYETPRDARIGLGKYLDFYNNMRPHQSLGYRTPLEVYKQRPQ